MKVIVSFTGICPSCNGKGYVSNPETLSTNSTIVCPACKGSKIIIINKTTEIVSS